MWAHLVFPGPAGVVRGKTTNTLQLYPPNARLSLPITQPSNTAHRGERHSCNLSPYRIPGSATPNAAQWYVLMIPTCKRKPKTNTVRLPISAMMYPLHTSLWSPAETLKMCYEILLAICSHPVSSRTGNSLWCLRNEISSKIDQPDQAGPTPPPQKKTPPNGAWCILVTQKCVDQRWKKSTR